MLDINLIRDHPDLVKRDLEKRNQLNKLAWVEEIRRKDTEWKNLVQQVYELRHMRNKLSQEISDLKKQKKDASAVLKQASEIPKMIQEKEDFIRVLEKEVNDKLMHLPNVLHESVPVGDTEEHNKVIKKFGKAPKFPKGFQPKSHVDLLQEKQFADLDRASKIAGNRFWFLKGELAQLELAIQHYAVAFMLKKGYTLLQPPYMMMKKVYDGVTDLATFNDAIYKIEGEDLYLIATSEHPLIGMFMDEILKEDEFPIRLVGISAYFRKEAGAHGKDTKGIFRGHQFNKVEQIIICKPQDSWKYHEEVTKNAIEFFASLGLHFRQVSVCTGDIGTIAAKKYDLECWMPVQQAYREVVSASNCTDYQARRLKIRYLGPEGTKITPHTLNSTCVATSRLLAAILENFQNPEGSVTVPNPLQKYMAGKKRIGQVTERGKKGSKIKQKLNKSKKA